jgi:ribosome-binding factor A
VYDPSVERGDRIERLLKEARHQGEPPASVPPDAPAAPSPRADPPGERGAAATADPGAGDE